MGSVCILDRGSGVALFYHESKGIHDWDFWNEYLERAIQWMLTEE